MGLSEVSTPLKIVMTMELNDPQEAPPPITSPTLITECLIKSLVTFTLLIPSYHGQSNERFPEHFKRSFYDWTTGTTVSKQGGGEGHMGKKIHVRLQPVTLHMGLVGGALKVFPQTSLTIMIVTLNLISSHLKRCAQVYNLVRRKVCRCLFFNLLKSQNVGRKC